MADYCSSYTINLYFEIMLTWIIIALIGALVFGLLGFAGIARGFAYIAKILFYIFVIVLLISLIVSIF